jgi:hypothetical protein
MLVAKMVGSQPVAGRLVVEVETEIRCTPEATFRHPRLKSFCMDPEISPAVSFYAVQMNA